jgi:hypothetical protein
MLSVQSYVTNDDEVDGCGPKDDEVDVCGPNDDEVDGCGPNDDEVCGYDMRASIIIQSSSSSSSSSSLSAKEKIKIIIKLILMSIENKRSILWLLIYSSFGELFICKRYCSISLIKL